MGKGQKQLQTTATNRSNEQYQAGTDAQNRLINSKEFADYKGRTATRRSNIAKGRFADAEDFLSNRDAVAKRKADYDSVANLAPTGMGALGMAYADPTAIAKMKSIQTDEFARDSALQAEEDKRQYIGQTELMENDILGKQFNTEATLMGHAFGNASGYMQTASSIAASRASVLPGIIGGVLGGAMSMVSAGMMRGGGGGSTSSAGPARGTPRTTS